jgi:hypothetical protein
MRKLKRLMIRNATQIFMTITLILAYLIFVIVILLNAPATVYEVEIKYIAVDWSSYPDNESYNKWHKLPAKIGDVK